jgi:hypothetical protein
LCREKATPCPGWERILPEPTNQEGGTRFWWPMRRAAILLISGRMRHIRRIVDCQKSFAKTACWPS